jgi:hypothetical protein
MNIARRTLAACTLTLAVLSAAPATGALASATSSHPAASHVSAAVVARGAAHVRPAKATPDGNPQGCPGGDMCIYRQGGGGDLCIATPGNEPNLGACANADEAVFNNGYAGNPNGVVAMNHLLNYTGAWTCIATGSYWLYTSDYYFNGGPGTTGYGESIVNSVASFHWQEHNCGSSMSP